MNSEPRARLGFPSGGNLLHVIAMYGARLAKQGGDSGLGLMRAIVGHIKELASAELNRQTANGLTPLMIAATQSNAKVMGMLLEAGASTLWGLTRSLVHIRPRPSARLVVREIEE